MELLTSLGVDSTLWIHAACFGVAFFALSGLVFKPYAKALAEREQRTTGNEEHAARLLVQATEINSDYEHKAKTIALSVRNEFEKSRVEAVKEYESLLNNARAETNKLLEASRLKIASELSAAQAAIAREIPMVTATIATKLAGKEISP